MSGSHASHTTTLDPSTRLLADQLIPPVPSTGRRVGISALVLVASVGLVYLALAGWLYPRLTIDGSGFSGDINGAQSISIDITNGGHRSIEIDRATVFAGDVGIPEATITRWPRPNEPGGAPLEITLPAVIEPSERLTISYDVVLTDCQGGVATLDARADISYHFADGPPSIGRSQRLENLFEGTTTSCNQ